jgi:hypothetical protein
MSFTPSMPSDFLYLVLLLCRHLPERSLAATIDWHLYGPAWTGGVSDLEDQLLRNTLHAAYDVAYSATSYLACRTVPTPTERLTSARGPVTCSLRAGAGHSAR